MIKGVEKVKKFAKLIYRLFGERTHPLIYAFFVNVYSIFRKNIFVIPIDNYWMAKSGDRIFYAPHPRIAFHCVQLLPWEEYEQYFKVEKGDVVVDAGAFIGDFTVYAAEKVGPTGVVVAIEPDPSNYFFLSLNTARLRNVKLINKCIWKEKKILDFYLSSSIATHSIFSSTNRKIKRDADKLVNILSSLKIKDVDFIKMDIEGAEIEALEGAREILRRTRKVAVAAYHLRGGIPTFPVVKKYLERLGFKVRVTGDGIVHAWKSVPKKK